MNTNRKVKKFKLYLRGGDDGRGFTLLEILLVVAAIAILAGIVIIAINPGKQLGDTRNAQRYVDVNTILNAVYQYALDNNGTLPAGITVETSCPAVDTEICRTGAASCTDLVDLAELTTNETYIVSVPNDPSGPAGTSTDGTGYSVIQTDNGRVTVCASNAEQSASISVTR